MDLILDTTDLSAYLAESEAIDHRHPVVRVTARRLRTDVAGRPHDYAQAAYEFVRDAIPHSYDSGDQRVPWRASDVLRQRNGICHTKSHALVALLRAEGIHAGLCYQRLAEDDGSDPVLHGLVALVLPGSDRWVRQDARGNKPGVDARFCPDGGRLAWAVRPELGERDYPLVHAAPAAPVLAALRGAAHRTDLARLLPEQLD